MESWEESSKWYSHLIQTGSSYFHNHLILPKMKELLSEKESILDLACGSGVLLSAIAKEKRYMGIDLSPSLLKVAKSQCRLDQQVKLADICDFHLKEKFESAVCILAIQNVKEPGKVFSSVAKHLQKKGRLYIVMTHPCFRIPRQSYWGVDEEKKMQYRRMDVYKKNLDIPIQINPSKKKSSNIFHMHRPLEHYVHSLRKSGFLISDLQEWTSPKNSLGKKAKMENRARDEFPLFLFLDAQLA